MISDKKEIENTVNNGRRILAERPELAYMSLQDVIDELDDAKQMIHDRWGVAAWLVVNSISEWELAELVKQLVAVESGVLTYEYVGYLLQNEYGIDLEALMLEADSQGEFDNIVKYVSSNLRLLTEIKKQYILPFLHMLEKHVDSRNYDSLINNYASGIAACEEYLAVMTSVGDINSRVRYDLICYLRRDWYNSNTSEANRMMDRLLENTNNWSQKAAIAYLDTSLDYDKTVFENHLPNMEIMLHKSKELWIRLIPVFIKYITMSLDEYPENQIVCRTIDHIKRIPVDSTEAKCSFLTELQWMQDVPEVLQKIFQSIISTPFDADQCPVNVLDHLLYKKVREDGDENFIRVLLEIFRINGYRDKYKEFFDGFNLSMVELSKTTEPVTEIALKYIISKDIDQVFFGLGLLMKVGNLQKLQDNRKENKLNFTNLQLIRILKAALYFYSDNEKVCHMAFLLLAFIEERPDEYIAFCVEEVYENYPGTLIDVAESYSKAEIEAQANLAELVKKAHEKVQGAYKKGREIKDLQPSLEHQYIYRRALQEQNRQINKKADEQSFLAKLFSKRMLKYGVRSAHVVHGTKGEKFFETAPYQYYKHGMELPSLYVDDPVGYAMKRIEFVNEVTSGAIDN